jgi:chaperonin cofactor prefoldin
MASGLVFVASAQTAAEHTQHHPETPAAAAPASKTAPAPAQPGTPQGMSVMPQMQQQMQQHMATMQALHTRMAAAKTAAEREALMADHMKAMHEDMAMMKGMTTMGGPQGMHGKKDTVASSPDLAQRLQMMEMRMDTMQNMMNMMMQRMPSAAPN